jgi:hypothetical protein
MLKVIASEGISNVASMNIYEMNEDSVLVGLNNEKPERLELGTNEEGEAFFEYGDMNWYLNNFLRTNMGGN